MSLDTCRRYALPKIFLFLSVLGSIQPAHGTVPPETVWATTGQGVPTFLSGHLGFLAADLPLGDAAAFFAAGLAAEELGPEGAGSFEVMGVDRDRLGQAHIRLAPRVDGRPVPGAEVIVHVDHETRAVLAMNGRWDFAPGASGQAGGEPSGSVFLSSLSNRRIFTFWKFTEQNNAP